jgi:hypothetical protein
MHIIFLISEDGKAVIGDCPGTIEPEVGYTERMNVAFDLPPAEAARLQEEADRLGIPPSDLARAAVADLLANRDEEFRAAAERVLRKNHELYRRLA